MLQLAHFTPSHFRMALAVLLGAAFLALQVGPKAPPLTSAPLAWQEDGRLHVFFHPDCPHCERAIAFLKMQPAIDFDLHDVSTPAGETLLRQFAAQHNISEHSLGVPLFLRGTRFLIGFDSPHTTGREILDLASGKPAARKTGVPSTQIKLPLLGEIDPAGYSLPMLTVLLGLSDGFNPCAMWVLVYLISLIAGVHDLRKIRWLIGTFVFASGVLYFLFMTAWLNAFLLVGYIRPLTQLIALAAIGFGLDHLFELAINRGVIVCNVGNIEQRQRTMSWMREIVAAPVGLTSLMLIVVLAFTVNAIEFVCSAALPAVYTHILTLTDLTAGQYYGYIALYVTFFMLDDLIIFGLAAFAVQKIIDTRYATVSRAAGGAIMIGLGAWMLVR
jgi:glutaredoxin